jgi:hypothetical protein
MWEKSKGASEASRREVRVSPLDTDRRNTDRDTTPTPKIAGASSLKTPSQILWGKSSTLSDFTTRLAERSANVYDENASLR